MAVIEIMPWMKRVLGDRWVAGRSLLEACGSWRPIGKLARVAAARAAWIRLIRSSRCVPRRGLQRSRHRPKALQHVTMDCPFTDDSPKLRPLYLSDLNRQISQHYPKHPDERDSPAQTKAWLAFVLGFAITLASLPFFPASLAKIVALSGLALETLAGVFIVLSQVRSMDREKMKQDFAAELDADYQAQTRVVGWIRSHGRQDISNGLRFVKNRLGTFSRRSGLLLGGMEKLGALPVLVALFLQFRDFELGWPPGINFTEALLGFVILVLYVGGLLAQSLKLRLHVYESLLEEALYQESGS
ncbi:hypothetical protein C3942_17995 [Solimonas fluminis]|uniref:Uncharacterized protein n=2 Tax=Solimonas fluminis TaxID=2086571 RepID=A0A2S5TBU3_9GAMM|nr:hypothetical protein C3942_17995 [Solimonas fluminis]